MQALGYQARRPITINGIDYAPGSSIPPDAMDARAMRRALDNGRVTLASIAMPQAATDGPDEPNEPEEPDDQDAPDQKGPADPGNLAAGGDEAAKAPEAPKTAQAPQAASAATPSPLWRDGHAVHGKGMTFHAYLQASAKQAGLDSKGTARVLHDRLLAAGVAPGPITGA